MFDIAIIGSGPAGASAALFSAKAGKATLLIDNDKSMTKRAWIENYYGIRDISGPDMIEKAKDKQSILARRWFKKRQQILQRVKMDLS